MKINPVGAEFLQEDGQTDMTKLTVAFRKFANASKSIQSEKNRYDITAWYVANWAPETAPFTSH